MPPEDIDVDALRSPGVDLDALRNQPSRKLPRHRPGEAFIKGPIPWPWVERAMTLPGKALAVGLMLWKEAGCRRNRTVRFRLAGAIDRGIPLDTARRGLRALAAVGLVSIRHYPGQALEVTLLETEPNPRG